MGLALVFEVSRRIDDRDHTIFSKYIQVRWSELHCDRADGSSSLQVEGSELR